MALQRQTISLPFARGVDAKTDPAQIAPGKLAVAENGVFSTPMSIRKRYGTTAQGAALSGTVAMATFKDELEHVAGDQLLRSYIPDSNSYSNNKGPVPCIDAKVTNVFSGSQLVSGAECDFAQHPNGLKVVVWTNFNGTAAYTVIDTNTGTQINYAVLDSISALRPKAISFNNYLMIFYSQQDTPHKLVFRYIDIGTPIGLSAAVTVVSPWTNTHFDVAVIGNKIYVAYQAQTTGFLSFKTIDAALTVSAATTTAEATTLCSVWGDPSNNVWSAYGNGSQTKVLAYDSTLVTPLFSPTVIEANDPLLITGIYDAASSVSRVLYSKVSSTQALNVARVTSAGSVTGPNEVIRSLYMYSKPFIEPTTSSVCLLMQYASQAQQSSYFLIRVNRGDQVVGQVVGKFMGPGNVTSSIRVDTLAEVSSATPVFSIGITQLSTETLSPEGTLDNVTAAILRITEKPALPAVEIANDLHLGGGFISSYDGTSVVEHGFHIFPEPVLGSPSGTGGSLTAGSYEYLVTYEWVDSQGNTHRSAPSLPLQVTTTTGTSKVTLTLPTLRVTAKTDPRRPVLIVVYRTAVNGTVFYRITGQNNPVDTVINDATVDSLSFIDINADSSIIGNSQIYTTGDEVENGDPGAVLSLTTYKTRLIAIPCENRLSFWYSKQVLPNVPVEMSPFFVQNIEPRGGDATAVAAMDDKLIIFKSSLIIAVTGEGPSPSGAGNDFTSGQVIATDTGCVSTPSVVLMPDGLMYQSAKGIELLDRGLGTHYIGADVERYMSGATVTAAVLVPTVSQVRFFLSSGICLVYDYFPKGQDGLGQWSVFTQTSAQAAVLYQGVPVYGQPTGQVLQESQAVFSDNGVFYALKVETPWLSLASLQGFQRAYKSEILGEWRSAHSLVFTVAYDFDTTAVQTETVAAPTISTPYQWRLLLNRQKCEAVKFTIQDSQTVPYGEGMRLSALAFEFGAKGGLQRSPQTKTYG